MKQFVLPGVVISLLGLSACGSSSNGSAPSGTGGKGQDAATSSTGGSSANGETGGSTSATGGTATTGGTTATGGGATGGVTTTGGTTGAGGASAPDGGTDAGPPTALNCVAAYGGTATRPLLTDESAACYSIRNYLAAAGTIGALVRDDWDPSTRLLTAPSTPTYTVAADGSGTHTTVQAAIDAANTSASTSRVYILVKPGSYRELVCVKGSVAITLYGADTDATRVVIAFDNYNSKPIDSTKVNGCAIPSATATTYGTSGSSTFFSSALGFQAMNLTIANDFAEGTLTSGIQAVALTVQGDQQVYQNVRLIGNQDTLQVKSPSATTVARSYFKNSYVEGDADFIFGRGTAVFDGCTITYVSSRKTNSTHISPSTESAHPFGFLIVNSKMVGDPGMPTGTAYLGRAWDDSSGTAPNGQAVIRDTEIGAQVNVTTPWTLAATSSRAFSASGNRLYEYQNTGPGSAGAPADGGTVVDAAMDEPAQHDGGGSATDGGAAAGQ